MAEKPKKGAEKVEAPKEKEEASSDVEAAAVEVVVELPDYAGMCAAIRRNLHDPKHMRHFQGEDFKRYTALFADVDALLKALGG